MLDNSKCNECPSSNSSSGLPGLVYLRICLSQWKNNSWSVHPYALDGARYLINCSQIVEVLPFEYDHWWDGLTSSISTINYWYLFFFPDCQYRTFFWPHLAVMFGGLGSKMSTLCLQACSPQASGGYSSGIPPLLSLKGNLWQHHNLTMVTNTYHQIVNSTVSPILAKKGVCK